MKFKSVIITVFCIFLFVPASLGEDNPARSISENENGPIAFLPSDKAMFMPVLEGEFVTHEFVLQNRGAGPLKIENVRTGCGCAVASYTKTEIPSRGEGNIVVRINTNGYGGRKMKKSVTVYTNDKDHLKLNLNLSGMVEKFAAVTPKNLSLRGYAGQHIASSVTIVPEDKYPFRISEAKAEKGKHIRIRLEEVRHADARKYLLTVENLKQEKGRYVDTVSLKTDSKVRPEILIRVYGNIQDKRSERKQKQS